MPAMQKENQVLLRLFQKKKLSEKSWMFLAFPEKNPIIWETFGALFAEVIDMTKLYILIIFDMNKIPRSI